MKNMQKSTTKLLLNNNSHKAARGRTAEGEPNPVDVYVGGRIRMRRVLLGLSQERFSGLLGMTFQQVQKYEMGRNRVSASRLWDIAQVLKTDINYFYQDMSDEIKKGSPRHQKINDRQRLNDLDNEVKALYDPLQDTNILKMINAINKIANPDIVKAISGLLQTINRNN